MRTNMPVTQRENDHILENELIISKTDENGVITYANDILCRISGFTEKELIGAPHNLMRHPDMPCVAYAWLWDVLQSGSPWNGIVKNRCKNGDHYWVEANVYPQVGADGSVCGYHSTRRKPSRTQVSEADVLYAELCRNEGEMESRGRLSRNTILDLYRNSPLYQAGISAAAA